MAPLTMHGFSRRWPHIVPPALACLSVVVACSSTPPTTQATTTPPGSTATQLDSSSTPTEVQALDLRAKQLAQLATDNKISGVTAPALVRWTNPQDWAPAVAGCLTDSGFPSTAHYRSVDGKFATAQKHAYFVAYYLCTAKYTMYPYYDLPPSRAAASRLYDWTVSTLLPCITAHGYTFDPPPSREVFVEIAISGPAWTPYTDTLNGQLDPKRGALEALNVACPSTPDQKVYFEHDPVPAQH